MSTIQNQNSLIFDPVKLDDNYKFTLPDGVKEVFIPVSKSVKLNGLLYEKPGCDTLLIYFQGNAKNLQNWLDNHKMALNWGYNVLVTDYRGFGKSGGRLNGEDQMYDDAEKIFDFAIRSGYKPEKIILYGYSMGSGMACHLATVRTAFALILESPYSSIANISWVGDNAPDYSLNNAQKATIITIPTLIIHGKQDDVIPFEHSEKIYKNLETDEKQLILLEGGGHGNLRQRSTYKSSIVEFIKSILDKPGVKGQ